MILGQAGIPKCTEYANTAACHDCRDDDITDSTQCSGVDFDKDKQSISRCHVVQDLDSDADDFRITRKQMDRYFPAVIRNILIAMDEQVSSPKKADTHTFSYAVIFPGAIILSDKVVAEIPKAEMTIQQKASIFPKEVHAATVSVPRAFRAVWIIIFDKLYMAA